MCGGAVKCDSMVLGKLEMRISLCEILISSFPWTMLSHLMGQLQLLWRPSERPALTGSPEPSVLGGFLGLAGPHCERSQ